MILSFIGGALFGGTLGTVTMMLFKTGCEQDAYDMRGIVNKALRGEDIEIAGITYSADVLCSDCVHAKNKANEYPCCECRNTRTLKWEKSS